MFIADNFKEDLQNGMPLEEALQKHNISLADAVELMKKQGYHRKKKRTQWNAKTGEKYISKTRGGKYAIRKHINGKMRYFGYYDNIEDAIKVRNYLYENGWYWQRINAIREKLGV